MIKKIKVEELKPGVFGHDFNCGWLHHPFLADRTKLKIDKDIDKVIKYGIRELYIDTEKGLDVDDAPPQRETRREIQDEIARAKQLIGEVKEATKKLMHDIRLGGRMDVQQVEGLVDRMTDSVLND